HLPVVIRNTPSITDAGYIGGKVEHILKRMLEITDDNLCLAQAGVICLDEVPPEVPAKHTQAAVPDYVKTSPHLQPRRKAA
ncbi:MAG: hypothetical protein NTY53_16135, partial [Kiritimatiellaeota bacterium]|nr:hypothetical protein [Kiritimatiellota bacterium]